MITLVVHHLDLDQQYRPSSFWFDFSCQEIKIGRNDDNNIVLKGERISKYHARIELEVEKVIIVDLDSTNGVFIMSISGPRRIARSRISNGDIIRIGDFALQFYIEAEDDTSKEDRERLWFKQNQIQYLGFLLSMPNSITPKILRQIVDRILPTDSDIDEFCIDYFPAVAKRLSGSMDRKAKVNLLIRVEGHEMVYKLLLEVHPNDLSRWIEQLRIEHPSFEK